MSRILVLPLLLIAFATAARLGGLDPLVSDAFFDFASGRFALRAEPILELLGHRVAKSMVLAIWFLLLATAIASAAIRGLQPLRLVLWTTVLAMAAGPAIVVALKSFTGFHCPWNLQRYGGFASDVTVWFTHPSNAGHCFPAGHSAGGFSLIGVHFAGLALRNTQLARLGLVLAIAAGSAFSAVRIVQGAHFLSHTLWSAAIDWLAAAIVFAAYTAGTERGFVRRPSTDS